MKPKSTVNELARVVLGEEAVYTEDVEMPTSIQAAFTFPILFTENPQMIFDMWMRPQECEWPVHDLDALWFMSKAYALGREHAKLYGKDVLKVKKSNVESKLKMLRKEHEAQLKRNAKTIGTLREENEKLKQKVDAISESYEARIAAQVAAQRRDAYAYEDKLKQKDEEISQLNDQLILMQAILDDRTSAGEEQEEQQVLEVGEDVELKPLPTNVLFLGGFPELVSKLRALHPNWRFISTPDRKLMGKEYDVVFFWTKAISHKVTYAFNRSLVRDVPHCKVTSTNLDLLEQEMLLFYNKTVTKEN